MARASETGFYYEPLTERLALVVEGSPFPSDDHWAYVGDPIEMTPELARLEVAGRWPGVDPESLEVELDFHFELAMAEEERRQAEVALGFLPHGGEIDFDVSSLLAQAEELREAAAQMRPVEVRKDLERLLDANGETVGSVIIKANK